ncbi:DUF2634 domain-containing protein [Maledivibacter halophilus]|uniref:Uncharacterized protein n=1 Tax=Maledivibacter halophilus TaxID=36842 RepID=A0A1T5M3R0_9FIRM|nr:DUF2634 domain-containing protein [Maledivibacter halophilus]SKC82860.1 Protein of unknown function [Maledivibacter halophilus]
MLPKITKLQFKTDDKKDLPRIGKSFLFDFKKGDFPLKDGRLIEVTGIQALMVWIEKTLRTEKYRYKVYEREDKNEYGVILEDLIIGNNFPHTFVEAEVKREISQALTSHPMIQSLSNWKIEGKNPDLKISFKVNLVGGNNFNHDVNLLTLDTKNTHNTWDDVTQLTWEKASNHTWQQLENI